jgi:hypothetical protein
MNKASVISKGAQARLDHGRASMTADWPTSTTGAGRYQIRNSLPSILLQKSDHRRVRVGKKDMVAEQSVEGTVEKGASANLSDVRTATGWGARMIDQNASKKHWVLIEGPAPGDAQFLGQWLLTVAKADKLLQEQFERDPEFKLSVAKIELLYAFAFSPAATKFMQLLMKKSLFLLVLSL